MRLKKILFLLIAASFILTAAVRSDGSPAPDSGGTRFLNDRSEQIIGADLLYAPGFVTPAGLTGRGQVVAVADSGLDRGSIEDIHPDLASEPGKKPRIIMLKSWAGRQVADDPVGHGTHMVGTIAGSGVASGGKFKGVAPDASIYFQGILDQNGNASPPADMAGLFLPAYQAGARIHVDAWGSGPDTYSGTAMKADSFAWNYPDFLVIFGAGNSGPAQRSLTSEANSKNALVVGASVSPRPALDFSPGGTLERAQFSSRGPAGDGRIKPDLLAPGTSIISARSGLVKGNLPGFTDYTRMQGTSMASAVTAGAAALMREFMQREMDIPDPRAASLKAALINGARTPEGGPSADGFGVVDLAGAIIPLKDKTVLLAEENGGLAGGEAKKYSIRVDDPSSPLKVTLAWTDPTGDQTALKALVNNLDLAIKGPDGRTYYGNSFLGRAPDDLNNVEQVYIKNPVPGEYKIEVRAPLVSVNSVKYSFVPRQDYSLVYGQIPATGIVSSNSKGGLLTLFGGGSVDLFGKAIRYAVDGQVTAGLKPAPGNRVYYGGKSVYIVSRLWRPDSAQAKEGPGGRVWYEIDQDSREGGYYQSPDAPLTVNGVVRPGTAGLPPGISLEAILDGQTQTLWRVDTNFRVIKGNVSRVVIGEDSDITSIELFKERKGYPIPPDTSYIYNDTFERSDPMEMVFGSGNLDGMTRIMPGQMVSLVMSPLSGAVSSILVERSIVSGYVSQVSLEENMVYIGNHPSFHIMAGTRVQKDRAQSALNHIEPGDYAVAVVIPGSGEILGLAAYSNVTYGRVLFTSDKDHSIYINDFHNNFQIYTLSPETEVMRWGLAADVSTLTSGTWVRVTLSPDGSVVWRMDVAELLEDELKSLAIVEPLHLVTGDGEKYRLSESFTVVTKDGFQVQAGDLLPGEKVTVVSLLAPAPYNKVPVAVRASSLDGSRKPDLMAAVKKVNGHYTLSGYTSGDRLYIWHESGAQEDIPLRSGRGAFSCRLTLADGESSVRVVAVDSRSGGVIGKNLYRPQDTERGFADTKGHWAADSIAFAAASGVMSGYGDGTFRPDRPLTGSELSYIRDSVTASITPESGGPGQGDPNETITRSSFIKCLKGYFSKTVEAPAGYRLPFTDCEQLSGDEREALAWGSYWGIITGRSPGIFGPADPLTRAEAATIIRKIFELLAESPGV